MKKWEFSEFIAGDIALFNKINDTGEVTIVLVYVDDMSIFASTMAQVDAFKKDVSTEYKFADMGEITHYLGLHITRDRKNRTFAIDQSHYIEKMIERYELKTATPKKTPLATSTQARRVRKPHDRPHLTTTISIHRRIPHVCNVRFKT